MTHTATLYYLRHRSAAQKVVKELTATFDPLSAKTLRESLGVNTQGSDLTTVYAGNGSGGAQYSNITAWLDLLSGAGVTYIRALYVPGAGANFVTARLRERNMRWLMLVVPEALTQPTAATLSQTRAVIDDIYANAADVCLGIEGINEPNQSQPYLHPDGQTYSDPVPGDWAYHATYGAMTHQQAIYQQVHLSGRTWPNGFPEVVISSLHDTANQTSYTAAVNSLANLAGCTPNQITPKNMVASVAALPTSSNAVGDTRTIGSTGDNYTWSGTAWVGPVTCSGGVKHTHQIAAHNATTYGDSLGMHTYPTSGNAPTTSLSTRLSYVDSAFGQTYPVWATEWGYTNTLTGGTNNARATETASGIYGPRGLLQFFGGLSQGRPSPRSIRLCSFEALDEYDATPNDSNVDDHYGWWRVSQTSATTAADPTTWSAKPLATSMSALMAALDEPDGDDYTPNPIKLNFDAGGVSDVQSLVVSKRDGTSVFFVWRNVSVMDPATKADLAVAPVPVIIQDINTEYTLLVDGRVQWVNVVGQNVPPQPPSTGTRFAPVRISGGGTIQVLDKHPVTGVIVAGSDTQGYYRSADGGDHWTVVNRGLGKGSSGWHGCAAIVWSKTEPNTVYSACGGSGGGGGSGWLVGVDNGTEVTWSMRSTAVNFSGNRSNSPLPQTDPRSSGYLIAQDSQFIFAATYDQGVARSSNNGKTWTYCTMAGAAPGNGNYYARSLAQDPSNSNIVYVAMYGYDGTHGHVWKCTNAHSTTPDFTKLTASPIIVEELRFVGNVLYAAAGGDGIYKTTDGGTTWTALNGSFVNTSSSIWSGLDGYVDPNGAHVLIASDDNPTADHAACLIRLSIPQPSGSITYTKLTGSVKYTIPPENRSWWNAGGSLILGQGSWANGFVFIDESVSPIQVLIAGRSGTYRSIAGSNGTSYEVANNGEPCFLGRALGLDPRDAGHLIFGSTDWNAFEITDSIGYDASTGYRLTGISWSGQGYGAAFDPVDSTAVVAGSTNKAVNNGGKISFRLPSDPTQTWRDTGYTNGGNVPTGIVALRNASNQKVIVVACWGGGIQRGVYNGTDYNWSNVSVGQTVCQGDVLTAKYEFTLKWVQGTPYLYVWDTNTGVWRSNDYGLTWTKVWTATSSDAYGSGLAPSPSTPGEVWVSNDTGLYRLNNVHTSVVGSGATATSITVPGKPGVVSTSVDGSIVYCVTQDTGQGAGIVYSRDRGVSWADAVGDGSLAGPAYQSTKMATAADDRLYLAGSNTVVSGYPVPIRP